MFLPGYSLSFIFLQNTGPSEPNGPVPGKPSAALKGEEENDSLIGSFRCFVFLRGNNPHGCTGNRCKAKEGSSAEDNHSPSRDHRDDLCIAAEIAGLTGLVDACIAAVGFGAVILCAAAAGSADAVRGASAPGSQRHS